MTTKTALYGGAGVLFLIGLCLVGYGILSVMGFGVVGVLFLAGGAAMIVAAQRGQKTEVIQQVKIDLPGQTKIEEMKCRSCGGTLSAKDITLVNGAPVVNCPYCGTTYQLTEEPKW
jgi:hypothetical protein